MTETETAADNLTKSVTSAAAEYKQLPNYDIEEPQWRREATADILFTQPLNGVISLTLCRFISELRSVPCTALLAVWYHVQITRVHCGIMNRVVILLTCYVLRSRKISVVGSW